MALSNRDVGNAWTAAILGALYEEWPRRLDFNAMDLETTTGATPKHESEELFDDLLQWLEDNGFIRSSDQEAPEGNIYGVALTERGHSILGGTPASLDRPLGTKLAEVATAAGAEVSKASIGQLVALAIGTAAGTFAAMAPK